MFIDLFNETLTLLGEPTVENLITALQKVNTTFLNQIDWDTTDVIDEEVVNAALDFVGYFLENSCEITVLNEFSKLWRKNIRIKRISI